MGDAHQARVLGRIAEEIDAYDAGKRTRDRLVENLKGLVDAADVDIDAFRDFLELWVRLDLELARFEPLMPADLASEERFRAALTSIQAWAIRVIDGIRPD